MIGSGAIKQSAAGDASAYNANGRQPGLTKSDTMLLFVDEPGSLQPTAIPTLKEGETLTVGDSDDRIPEIQNKLASLGYIESDEPDETFNEPLENAVKLFQRANNLNQTGEVDSLTLEILYSDTPAQYVIEHGNSGEDVKMVQERLTSLGYYGEKINGYYGTSTQLAIADFQVVNGLDSSGVVDIGTFDTLFSYDAIAESAARISDGDDQNPEEQGSFATIIPESTNGVIRTSAPTVEPKITPEPMQTAIPVPIPVITSAPTAVPDPPAQPVPTNEPFIDFNAEGYTNREYVNFRSAPSTESNIIMVLQYGTNVRIIARTSEWYRVMYAGHFGYIAAPYLTLGSLPTNTPAPTSTPTPRPTNAPTATPKPTAAPTPVPTAVPTPSSEPFVEFNSEGYINRPYVNFRSQPNTDSEIISVLTYGTQIQITAKTSEWYRVRYSGYTGYVASPYVTLGVLATPTPAPTAAPTAAPTSAPTSAPTAAPTPSATQDPFTPYNAQGYVNCGFVNFRSGPSTDYSVIAQLTYGTTVEVLATNGQWYRARHNGTVGYVFSTYITIGAAPTPSPAPTPTPPPSGNGNVESFVSVLRAQLGKPYVGGTQGPNTFDCSGYVYYCLKLCGVNIGRLTAAGYSAYSGWTRVNSFSDLRRGDLMFFYSNDYSRINHAAVYLGNGQLIHCSFSAGQVVISNANSNWYQNHFYCGRRVF